MLVSTTTCPSPPFSRPAQAMKQSIRRWVMPPRFISSPDRKNSGMASSAKLLMLVVIDCGMIAVVRLLP